MNNEQEHAGGGGAYPICSSLGRTKFFALFRPQPVGPPWSFRDSCGAKPCMEALYIGMKASLNAELQVKLCQT